VQDLDFTEAAIRFTQLQQQLQAGLATAARTSALSLLDFLR
jgi:flagellin-like hook-associated protein FlgL